MKDWKETRESKNEKGVTLLVAVIAVAVLLTIAIIVVLIVMSMGGQNKTETQAGSQDIAQTTPTVTNQAQETVQGTEGANGTKTLVQAFNDGEIQVGDYVNYVPDAHAPITVGTDKTGFTDSGGQLGTTDQTYMQDTTNTHWRVLGLTEDGSSVMLLGSQLKQYDAESNVDKQYLYLEGATGYKYCESTLNEICSLYHNNALAQETRSIKIEDINRALGGVTVTYPQEGDSHSGEVTLNNVPIDAVVTSYPSYNYQSGDYSPESYPNEVSSQIGQKVQANKYYYDITDEGGLNYSYMREIGSSISERGYNMLFEGTTGDENNAKSYWLASSGVSAASYGAYFGPGCVDGGGVLSGGNLFGSDGYEGWNYFAVRPVVILRSDVTVNDVHKMVDQTEQEWNTEGVIVTLSRAWW